MTIELTDALRHEYQTLFDTCLIAPSHTVEIESTTNKIAANRARYEAVGDPLDIPWFFVGVTHCLEGSLDFKTHLHNGDPLKARTVQVPKGRPKKGNPPFTWEESATDALTLEKFAGLDDWSLTSILYRFEKFNGFGYRTRGVNTPYLWSFSNHYTQGKFAVGGELSLRVVIREGPEVRRVDAARPVAEAVERFEAVEDRRQRPVVETGELFERQSVGRALLPRERRIAFLRPPLRHLHRARLERIAVVQVRLEIEAPFQAMRHADEEPGDVERVADRLVARPVRGDLVRRALDLHGV